MSTQDEDLDFELIDDNEPEKQVEVDVDSDEETTPSDKKSKDVSEDDTASNKNKSNSSNWKKANKTIKALREENRKLKEAKGKNLDDDEDDDGGDEEEYVSSTDMRLFVVENPEAKAYKTEIEEIIQESKWTLSFERAFALAKAERPEESQSEDEFGTKNSSTKVRKRLADLTEDEALKLPNSKYLEYQRVKGRLE